MASPHPGAAAVSIPAASGSGVLARLPPATVRLSAPKPHVGHKRILKRAGSARDEANGLVPQHRPGLITSLEGV